MDLNLCQCGTSIPAKGRFPLEDRSRERKMRRGFHPDYLSPDSLGTGQLLEPTAGGLWPVPS